MEIKSLGFRTDLMLLSLGGSELTERDGYVVVRTPANPTFWWGNFLLFREPFGPGETARRVDLFRQEFPDAKHVTFGVDSVDGEVGALDELAAAGFELERCTVMTATAVQEPRHRNDDSEYRAISSDDDWRQLVELSVSVNKRDIPDYEEFVERKLALTRELVEAGPARWFGAFDGNRLQASLGLVSDGSGVARFQDVQTREEDRGRGIAGTLVHHAATYGLGELGAKTLVMVADPEYLAIRIYRALGFDGSETQLQLTKPPA